MDGGRGGQEVRREGGQEIRREGWRERAPLPPRNGGKTITETHERVLDSPQTDRDGKRVGKHTTCLECQKRVMTAEKCGHIEQYRLGQTVQDSRHRGDYEYLSGDRSENRKALEDTVSVATGQRAVISRPSLAWLCVE